MVYNVKDGKVVASNAVDAGASGHSALAGLLSEPGASVLIGGGARQAPEEAGITLRAGVSGNADAAVRALLEGELVYDPDAKCSHHEHTQNCVTHDCGEHGRGGNCGD